MLTSIGGYVFDNFMPWLATRSGDPGGVIRFLLGRGIKHGRTFLQALFRGIPDLISRLLDGSETEYEE